MELDSDPLPSPPAVPARFTRAEWGLILVLIAIQFTHMVDFVIIMPLGKRLMAELTLSTGQFGLVVSAYAWAAGVASFLAGLVMDRFDRRTVLLTMYGGFAVSTLLCGLAPNFETLLVARALAGACGGLAAVALNAVIGDVFPPEKRGRAMGAITSAFAVASTVGLPIGLVMAEWLGRGAPFVALAGLSAAVWALGWFRLPAVRGHLEHSRERPLAEFAAVAREPNHLKAFVFSFFMVLGTFTVASFIGPYFSTVNGWGEGELAVIYVCAGLFTLVGMPAIGRLADRMSRLLLFRIIAATTVLLTVLVTNLPATPLWVACLALSAFMVFATGRVVPAQAMLIGAAAPRVRGAFLSLNTAVSHAAVGLGSVTAGLLMTRTPDGQLHGYPLVGVVAAASAVLALVLAGFVKQVKEAAPPIVAVPQHAAPPREVEPKAAAV